ncbi:hypothetical protein ACFX2C_014328 [Malus domestica]
MAELVFELVSKLINQLGSIVYNEISLAWGVKSDLQKLEHTMFTIKDVDLLDEFDCEALRHKAMETSHGTSRKVRHFFSRSNPIAFRFRVGLEIQEIGMVALPEWFRGAANTLQVLCIWYCENLDALPWSLTSFTSLRKLVLKSCPKLLSLPEGMHHLTALREVQIADCPHLESRCQRDIGEDCEKISHVPHVSFSFYID